MTIRLRSGWRVLFSTFRFLLLIALQQAHAAPTFYRDIAPILLKNCIKCHRFGGIASKAQFTSYDAVRPWAKAMKEAVTLRQMPPWSADPEHSLKFRNDPRLGSADIDAIRSWVDAGAPQGDVATGFNLDTSARNWTGPGGRNPDLVISMSREATIPATGDFPYVRFLVKLPLSEDKWIAACQARPGNASVVHHMAITEVETPTGVPLSDVDGLEAFYRRMGLATPVLQSVVGPHANRKAVDMLAIYTPGATLETYANDSGKLLKAGPNRYIDFNIHYSASGSEAKDRSEVAFWFRDNPPRHQIYRVAMSGATVIANGKELLSDTRGDKAEGTQVVIPPIPPGAADYELVSVTPFPQPVTLYQLHPHAHLRAKDFRYAAVYPDGREETLLTVPKYDFRWQMAYELDTPLKLPAGSKLVVTAHYDNSLNNKFNPAPEKEVYFRSQNLSTDEMFSPFVQYSVDTESPSNPAAETPVAVPQMNQAIGCLAQTSAGGHNNWILTGAAALAPVEASTATSEDINKAAKVPLGTGTFQLLGMDVFHPERHRGEMVLVRGLTTGSAQQLNVTSLLEISPNCPETDRGK